MLLTHLADRVNQGHEVLIADGVQRGDDQLSELGALLRRGVAPHGHLLAPVLPGTAAGRHQELVYCVILFQLRTPKFCPSQL